MTKAQIDSAVHAAKKLISANKSRNKGYQFATLNEKQAAEDLKAALGGQPNS